jgi:hypothetical protein
MLNWLKHAYTHTDDIHPISNVQSNALAKFVGVPPKGSLFITQK